VGYGARTVREEPPPLIDVAPVAERSAGQAAREASMREVEETLLAAEAAIRRATRAREAITCGSQEPDRAALAALACFQDDVDRARQRLQRDAWFAGDQQRLM
jgi:hypothetical protein